jgi:hypothetical protein
MNWFNELPTIYLHRAPVDFRKAVNGLCGLVQDNNLMGQLNGSKPFFKLNGSKPFFKTS